MNTTTIMQSLTFIIFIVSKEIATSKFLQHKGNQPASLTLIITEITFFMSVNNEPTERNAGLVEGNQLSSLII